MLDSLFAWPLPSYVSSFVSSQDAASDINRTSPCELLPSPKSAQTTAPTSSLPFEIMGEMATFATLLASPLVYPIARQVHPQAYLNIQHLVDRHWHSLPAITQSLLYEVGYRNAELESLPSEQRRLSFPPPPTPALTSRRVAPVSSDGAGNPTAAVVYGWPSSGGVWVKNASSEELQSLGLSLTDDGSKCSESKPSTLPTEEDAFCARLEELDATHYQSMEAFRLSRVPCLGYDETDLTIGEG